MFWNFLFYLIQKTMKINDGGSTNWIDFFVYVKTVLAL